MKVICNNHKKCPDRNKCYHGTEHEHEPDGSCRVVNEVSDPTLYSVYGCTCSTTKRNRLEKLNKIFKLKILDN